MPQSRATSKPTRSIFGVVGDLFKGAPNGAALANDRGTQHLSRSSLELDHLLQYERIIQEWGPLKTNLVASVVSNLNGSIGNAKSHSRAFQLHFLAETDGVFALDDADILMLFELRPGDMVEKLAETLIEANLPDEAEILRRSFELYVYPQKASGYVDGKAVHLIKLLNARDGAKCASGALADQYEDPILYDPDLESRYSALREA